MTTTEHHGVPTSMKPTSGAQYAIRYWRDREWAQRWTDAGVLKVSGWVTSPYKYDSREQAMKDIDHINRLGPTQPCELAIFWHGVER